MVWSREGEPQPLSVILPRFYLGAESDVTQDRLASLGISYVLSVSRCSPQPSFLPRSRFLRIPIDDSLRDDLLSWIPGALHFIDAAMSSGASVLVHCAAGISRSPALAVAYIMYRLDLDLDQAYRFVKECRPSISPNFNFLGQLQHFQNTLNQRSAGNEDCFTLLEDKRLFLNPRANSSNSQEATGASSRCLGLAQQRFSDEPWNPCKTHAEPTAKPAQLQLPSGSASLLEKRKSLTLSFVPLATHPPSSAVHPTPEATPAHSRGAMGKTEAETRSNGAPCRLARDLQGVSQVEQGLLSPLSVTLNKLLDWGGRVMLGGMFMPPVRMGQPVLPYKC